MPRRHTTGSAASAHGARDRRILDAEDELRYLATSSDPIFVVDPYADEILDVSQGAASVLGYGRDAMRGMRLSDLYHGQAPDFLAFLRAVAEGGEHWTDRFGCMDAEGRTVRTELAVAATTFQDRKAVIGLLRRLPRHRPSVLSAP
jgi:PAS domain S-box-containing protein